MTRPTFVPWIKRLALAAVLICTGAAMAPKSADAQLYLNLPFVSLGVGYPYYSPHYYGYGYPYYRHAHYWGYHHHCHWWHHHCHYY
jgi:hypothetical protein